MDSRWPLNYDTPYQAHISLPGPPPSGRGPVHYPAERPLFSRSIRFISSFYSHWYAFAALLIPENHKSLTVRTIGVQFRSFAFTAPGNQPFPPWSWPKQGVGHFPTARKIMNDHFPKVFVDLGSSTTRLMTNGRNGLPPFSRGFDDGLATLPPH